MKRLIVLILAAITAMTLTCGGIIAIRRMIPHTDTELVPGLRKCGETYCYWGVAFDKTSLDEAHKILVNIPLAVIETDPNHYWSEKYKTAYVLLRNMNGLVGGVIITENDPNLLTGDVVQYLGNPCYVVSSAGVFIITYQSMRFFSGGNESGNSWTLSPIALITNIQLTSGEQNNCSLTEGKEVFVWHGFGQYR